MELSINNQLNSFPSPPYPPLPPSLQGEIPPVARQSFTNLIFQPPKVGPIVLEDDDLIAIYEPETQSVTTVTRKEFNKL